MYTIKQASVRSGVPVPLLRAWERRYAVVAPVRTASGYRLYDDAAIARLAAMRRLVDDGWTASQAAEAVRGFDDAALALQAQVPAPAPPGADASTAPARGEADDRGALVAAAADYDTASIERVLDGLFTRGSYEAVVDDLLLPAVAALGAAWADGTLDIAAEHLASEAVQRRLAALFDGSSAAGTGQPVVVGLPPGNLHEIGTIAFAVALRRRGLDVLYLGPDVPVHSWVHAATTRRARAAVIGVARGTDLPAAREVATALLAADPGLLVALGGPEATPASAAPGIALPARVADAAEALAAWMAVPRG
jgi:MerR family transcriptional regulator, light-induced transcriptional regulator